ncbi:hypothetical protein BDQ17DRAFT_1434141 [Cyathus striatus]|nr:hypothetical protein BDQ17DRAFT_1434141 [Cyathus striatus]
MNKKQKKAAKKKAARGAVSTASSSQTPSGAPSTAPVEASFPAPSDAPSAALSVVPSAVPSSPGGAVVVVERSSVGTSKVLTTPILPNIQLSPFTLICASIPSSPEDRFGKTECILYAGGKKYIDNALRRSPPSAGLEPWQVKKEGSVGGLGLRDVRINAP